MMTAVKFIEIHGLVSARQALKNAPNANDADWYFYWCEDCGHGGSSSDMLTDRWDRDYCACPKCGSEKLQCDDGDFEKLSRLVESFESA